MPHDLTGQRPVDSALQAPNHRWRNDLKMGSLPRRKNVMPIVQTLARYKMHVDMDHVARRSEKGAVWLGAMMPQDKYLVIISLEEI